jgi:SnoaL-like protein
MPELDVYTRLAHLEAKEEVREFIASYCAITDRIDKIGDLVALFTEDAVLRNPAGVHAGRAAIESYYTGFFANGVKFSRHHAVNQVITILEPGTARHESYFIAFLGLVGESRIAFGRYEDLVVKQEGLWRFKDKYNDIVANTSLEAGWAEGFGSAGVS